MCNSSAHRTEEQRLQALLNYQQRLLPDPTQQDTFKQISLTRPPATVRANRLSPQFDQVLSSLQQLGTTPSWCSEAFELPASIQPPGHSLEHQLGALYVQAKATTLAVETLAPHPGERVLDMAASPGGKTVQLADRMANTGLLLANDVHPKRMPALVGNLERCGVHNAIISRASGTLLARYFHNYFDRILLDAPCSGDGIIRKDRSMLRYWSPSDAQRKSQLQKGLLRAAFHMLRPGGTLVYSTCALTLEENEDSLLGLWHKFSHQIEVLPVDRIEPTPLPPQLAADYPVSFSRFVRVWPHLHNTEGAFVAHLRKTAPTTWTPIADDANTWLAKDQAGPEEARRQLEKRWGFSLPDPPGQTLTTNQRYLSLQPAQTEQFSRHFPYFLKAGMHVGRRHKEYYYLSQQAITLWGDSMAGPRIELTWDQVCQLFKDSTIELAAPLPRRGEVLCSFGPWTLCRGLIEADRKILKSMLPKSLRTQALWHLS